jgi:hypothetical protein
MGVLAFVRILLVDGVAVLPILILAMPVLLSALAVATRWRWAPLFAAVMVLITTGLPLAGQQDTYELLHPAQFVPFLLGVIALAVAMVAIVAGIAATIQNYRGVGETSHLPRWATLSLGGLANMVLGILLVSLLVSVVPQNGAASILANGEPVVHMGVDTFLPNAVLVPTGVKLLLANDDPAEEHLLQNGMWDANGTPHPLVEPGAPPLHHVQITGGSLEIGPFTTAGVYHIYCSIHRGMNLTMVVQ